MSGMAGVPTEADAMKVDSLFGLANEGLAGVLSSLDLLVGADKDWRPITLEDIGALGTLIDLVGNRADEMQAMLVELGAQFRWLRATRGDQRAAAT
jgi:hypothetical protein